MIDARRIPLSIYIHWPWCVRKCPYCDFNSHRRPADLAALEPRYMEAVLADLAHWAPYAAGREVVSIFIGGGTPSLMSGASIERLIEGAAALYPLASDCEVTLEANPGTTDEKKFHDFREAGVNRLSLGVQSLSDDRLRRIGRIHSAADARRAIAQAAKIFDNFNLDLMFALPGETMEALAVELDEAAASGATHLSCYQLTIEPGTAFAKRLPDGLPDADETADMGDLVAERLAAAGFERYEVSGYAKPGRRCRHNLNYWTFGDYFAAGAGAHGKATSEAGVHREARWASPARYLEAVEAAGSGAAEAADVEAEALPFEFMLNALRLIEGVPASLFEERTGLPLASIKPTLAALRRQKLLEPDESRLCTTPLGMRFLSDVQEAFL